MVFQSSLPGLCSVFFSPSLTSWFLCILFPIISWQCHLLSCYSLLDSAACLLSKVCTLLHHSMNCIPLLRGEDLTEVMATFLYRTPLWIRVVCLSPSANVCICLPSYNQDCDNGVIWFLRQTNPSSVCTGTLQNRTMAFQAPEVF